MTKQGSGAGRVFARSSSDAASGGDVVTPEMLERMEAALLTLPRFTREVFLAHRLDDLDYGEIASITGVSVRRIEREIARSIFALHRALTEPETPAPIRWWERWPRR